MVIANIGLEETDEMELTHHNDMVEQLRRQEPILRSATGFRHGLKYAVRHGFVHIERMNRMTAGPKIESRSKMRCRGAVS